MCFGKGECFGCPTFMAQSDVVCHQEQAGWWTTLSAHLNRPAQFKLNVMANSSPVSHHMAHSAHSTLLSSLLPPVPSPGQPALPANPNPKCKELVGWAGTPLPPSGNPTSSSRKINHSMLSLWLPGTCEGWGYVAKKCPGSKREGDQVSQMNLQLQLQHKFFQGQLMTLLPQRAVTEVTLVKVWPRDLTGSWCWW